MADLPEVFDSQALASLSEAEKALMEWGVPYEKKQDGTLFVPRNLNISSKGLTRLPDMSSVSISGGFSCFNNQLTSLEGAPQTVGGVFSCDDNQLTSLKGAPQTVGGVFCCSNNQLTSLEGAPDTCQTLFTDFGEFSSWDAVPENLRLSPETAARIKQEKQAQAETAVRNAVVLQAPVAIKSPLRFRQR